MSDAFASGRILDLLLALTVVEAVLLLASRRARLLPTVGAGIGLLLGARLMLGGAFWGYAALCLLGAGLCHAADVRWRWSRG